MQIVSYFLEALQNDAYHNREWIISVFTVADYPFWEEVTDPRTIYEYKLYRSNRDPDKLYFYKHNEEDINNHLHELDGFSVSELKPLAKYSDRIELKTGDLLNVRENVETTFGNCIFNAMCLIYAFGDKIPFMTGRINGSKLEKMIAANLHDTPAEGEPRLKDRYYVDELIKHATAINSLDALSYTCVPTTSEKTMLPNPAVVKRRDELLKQYANELHKPAVIAKIQSELAKLDKEYFKGDRAEGFYLSDKAYDISRMKKFTMLGLIGGFGGNEPSLMTTSLAEGYKPEELPTIADDIRSGSYSRGKSTAIAGAGVKLVYNALQSVTIADGDCGQKNGMPFVITKDNVGDFDGRYMITKTGLVELTKPIVEQYIGQTIYVRTPMLCKQEKPSFCSICAGKSLSMLPDAVHIVASDINSIYMNITMKSMHGKTLKTKRLDIFSQ